MLHSLSVPCICWSMIGAEKGIPVEHLFTDAYCFEVLVVFPKGSQGGQRAILPILVQRAQVSRQDYGWCVIAYPNSFTGILHVAFHCQEVCGNGCRSWVSNSHVSLFGSHGGYQGRVLGNCFVGCQRCQKKGCHVIKIQTQITVPRVPIPWAALFREDVSSKQMCHFL